MAGVFLSYASEDRERVAVLADALRAEGFEVWWDREIPIAVTYEDHIRQQLDTAGAVVVVWSRDSVASRYVRWEVRRAERRGVLVPLMIEEADLPPEYFLMQAADLIRWTGDRSDREWRRLVAALVRLVGEPMPPEAGPVAAGPSEAPAPEAIPPAPDLVEGGEHEAASPADKEAAALSEAEIAESLRTWEPSVEEIPAGSEAEEDITAEARAAATGSRRAVPWYRRWWALAAAGALLLAAVVVPTALVLTGDGGEEALTTLPASTTQAVSTSGVTEAPTTTATPTTIAPPDVPDMDWARVPSDLVPALMPPAGWGVEFGSGRVAVGSDGSGGDEDAAVYVTPDGVTWERVPHDEAVFGGDGDQVMRAVTAWSGGLVAVGQDGSYGAVWTSIDGYTWERVPDEAGVFGRADGPWEVWGVTAGGPGLVAVGTGPGSGTGLAPEEWSATVWTSADAVTWERVPWSAPVFAGRAGSGMASVGIWPGGLVAVGWEYRGGSDWDAAVWTSIDGVAWERVPHDEAVLGASGDQEMSAVVGVGSGLLAAGWDDSGGDPDAAVWVSADGVTWERVLHDDDIFGGDGRQSILGLAKMGGLGLVAWGEDLADPYGKGIWVSPPLAGLEWAPVPYDEAVSEVVFGGPGRQSMLAVAAGGPGLVGVGFDDFGDERDAAVWISRDGLAWERMSHDEEVFGGPGEQWMEAVAVGGPGLVAVGRDYPGGEFTGSAAVWTSTDGLTWERAPHDEAVFGGDGDQVMRAVTAWSGGLVAVGWDDDDGGAAAWTSVDGIRWQQTPPIDPALAGCSMQAVATHGSGVVAAGICTPSEDWTEWHAAIWASADGLTWERIPHDEEVFGDSTGITALAAWEGGLMAVGSSGLQGDDSDVVVWTSNDGMHWTRMPEDGKLGGSGDQWVDDLAAGIPGLVAVGTEVWISSDGATWASGDVEDAGRFSGVATLGWRLVAVGTDGDDSAVWVSPPPG